MKIVVLIRWQKTDTGVETAAVRREFKIIRKSKSHYHEAHEEHEVKNVCVVDGIRFGFPFIPGGS